MYSNAMILKLKIIYILSFDRFFFSFYHYNSFIFTYCQQLAKLISQSVIGQAAWGSRPSELLSSRKRRLS